MSSQRNIIIKRARELMQRMTPAESAVWDVVRDRRFRNLKFLRQHPLVHNLINGQLYYFIADFYCDEKKLVVEIDGSVHEKTKEYDQMRDTILKEFGLQTIRIRNEDVLDETKLQQILTEVIKG